VSGAILLVLIVAALALAEGVYYLARFVGERPGEELKRRLRTVGEDAGGVKILRKRRLASSELLNDLLSGSAGLERLERLLDQTDLDVTVAQLLTYSAALAVIGGVTGGLILHNLLLGLLLGAGLAALPVLLVVRARARRARRISEQLPEALEMMARAIKAGHALPSSFKLIAQETAPPVAVEFGKAYEQQNLGLSFEAAVLNMTERVPSNMDLRLFAVSVMIQKETGGNLVEVLENISRTMRERFKFYSKLRALTAEGRISGWILGSMPFVVALIISVTNPGYIAELNTPGLGRTIIAGGAIFWTLGILWIRSLMKVEF
jgi:tight adherence protein B